MNTIHLSDKELETARQGMRAFLVNFGHDEAETIAAIRSVLSQLAAAQSEPGESAALS